MTEYPTREQLRINGTTDYYNDGVTFNKAADTSADGYILYRFFSGTSKVITKDPSYVPPPALTPVQIQKVIDDIDRGQSLGVHSRTGDTTTLSNNAGDWFLDSDDNNRMYQATDSGQNLMAFTAVSLPGISSGVIQDAQASYTALVAGGLVTEGNLGFVTVEEIGTGTPANPQYPKGIYKNTGGVLAIYSEDAGNQAPAFHEPATRGDTVQNVAPTALEVPNVVEGDTARVELSDGAREWWLYTGGAWVKRSYVPASGAALTQAQAESTTGADYSAEGTVSAEVLDFWGISRRVQRIFDVTTTFDYPALNYADRTAVYVRNANSASGISYVYRTDNTVSLELRRADGTTETDTPSDNDFNVQPGEIVFGEKDGNVFRASIIPGERVKNFTNATTANAFGPMPHDSIVTLRDESKIAWRRNGINNASFPNPAVTNTDWWVFDLGTGVINPDDITEWSSTETDIAQGALRKFGDPIVIYGRIVSDAAADGGTSPDAAKWQEVNQAADNVLTVIDSDAAGGNFFAVYGSPSLYEVTGATPVTILFPSDGGINANLRSIVYNKGTSTVTIGGQSIPAGGIAFIQADPDVDGPFVWASGSVEIPDWVDVDNTAFINFFAAPNNALMVPNAKIRRTVSGSNAVFVSSNHANLQAGDEIELWNDTDDEWDFDGGNDFNIPARSRRRYRYNDAANGNRFEVIPEAENAGSAVGERLPVIDLDGVNVTVASLGKLDVGSYRYTVSAMAWSSTVDGASVIYEIKNEAGSVIASTVKDYETSHITNSYLVMPDAILDFDVTSAQEYTVNLVVGLGENPTLKTVSGIRYNEGEFVDKDAVLAVEDAETILIETNFESGSVHNTFHAFSTGETWADIKANYEYLRLQAIYSSSGTSYIEPKSLVIEPDELETMLAISGSRLFQTNGGYYQLVDPTDTDAGFTVQQSGGDAPSLNRMRFKVVGIKKRTTVTKLAETDENRTISTAEVNTGRQLDGKDIYRIQLAANWTGGSESIMAGVDSILSVEGNFVVNTNAKVPPVFYDGSQLSRWYQAGTDFFIAVTGFASVQAYNLVVEYTKV